MIQRQFKLKLTKAQEVLLVEWLWMGTGLFNWALRKIELDAADGLYYTKQGFQNLLADHSKKLGMPSHMIQGLLVQAYISWERCFKKLAKKPRLKSARNRLNSLPFPNPIKTPVGTRVKLPFMGEVRFHRQDIPAGSIKGGRIIRRTSGWYLALTIDAQPNQIPAINDGVIGIDPGYNHLITQSNGVKVENPKELLGAIKRLGQAQRGHDKKAVARLHERIANQRKDRNHKLSRQLVAENAIIAFSKDNLRGLSRTGFGKSVTAASHGQLRSMLAYKSRAGGRKYIEVPGRNSTRSCSACGALTGPQGRAGLSVRQWECSACGTPHDRDVNAAINTLMAAVGMTVEGGLRHAA
ncbi:RNA-guided endonuclease InsQ/TnpB family protein [Ferrovum myxofaciens]|uniref:Transposase n=1 Tax=Ferrovum myxofaciens TaxID=416213 RepID=A0A9E6MZ68_9PROT|nr:transposase [Ferrovum myxofaciens]QKE37393.1 MAG: transposase [Ferrovum myxofaciens]QWY75047.1 MAG: transposase [Ferrovum myxofaciens]QWY77787.1 MAG: transposase [Ferrovum myxofaciens]